MDPLRYRKGLLGRAASKANSLALILGMMAAPILAPVPASAEWYWGFYLGSAKTRDIPATVDTGAGFVSGTIQGKSSTALGFRLGYWFEGIPWLGLTGDFSGFGVAEDLRILSGGLFLMARAPLLRSQEHPQGRLQPYVGVGWARHQTLLTVGEVECLGCAGGPIVPLEEESFDVGPDYRAGLTWWIGNNWGVFGEYRRTRVKAGFTAIPEMKIETNHGNLGLVRRW